MSKELFSKKISTVMNNKIKSLECMNIYEFLKKEEYFELALCLSYMTLSKEKIIHKEMKNTDRLDRLTKYVKTIDIDEVFSPTFSKNIPTIISARENNNLWILDNIKDSIMHGQFEINEDKKCFIINNKQFDRELVAEVPFDWFISYAKNDILSKKEVNKHTTTGFFYNKKNKDAINIQTKKELFNTIYYRVKITGDNFNVKNIENKINELFKNYSIDEITPELHVKYEEELQRESKYYDEDYLLTFFVARDKIIDEIKKDNPNLNIEINIFNRKYKTIQKIVKRSQKFYKNYDLFFEHINNVIRPKGMSLLKYIKNIIENLDKIDDSVYIKSNKEIMQIINNIVGYDKNDYTNYMDVANVYKNNLNFLREICMNMFGLVTLVINENELYDKYFCKSNPEQYHLLAHSKKTYVDFARTQKSLIMKILKKEIELDNLHNQATQCNDANAIIIIKTKMQNVTNDLYNLNNELFKLYCDFSPYINKEKMDEKKLRKYENIISEYYQHFYRAKNPRDREKIRKIIGKIMEEKIEFEKEFKYGCCDMEETIKIIRNCFSHIGRMYIGKDRQMDTIVILNDYDNNNEKSGEVICRYVDLINVLTQPLQSVKEETTLTRKKQ